MSISLSVTPEGGSAVEGALALRLCFSDVEPLVSGRPLGEMYPTVVDGALQVIAVGGLSSAFDSEAARRLGAALVRRNQREESLVVDATAVASGLSAFALGQALGEGALLGSYRFDRYRSERSLPKDGEIRISRITFVVEAATAPAFESGMTRAAITSRATTIARDLINEPPSEMTPTSFTEEAMRLASDAGLVIRVWDETDAARERLGGLLGVARGSVQPPRMLKISYVGPNSDAHPRTAIVGKGITFDSGGLSLKSGDGMMTMKTDMSGAAAVLATICALPALEAEGSVDAYMALTENMPSGSATKPGDVLVARNGKTIEVLNTDAEGRLVLADALSLAVEDGAERIVDLATLTGACVVALGDEIAGLLGNDVELQDEILASGELAGEDYWKLPLPRRYQRHIDSEIADLRNIGKGGRGGGTLAAGLFLEEFVGDTKWAHLDIAGPARSDSNDGYLSQGGTGFGVRTLLAWLSPVE